MLELNSVCYCVCYQAGRTDRNTHLSLSKKLTCDIYT